MEFDILDSLDDLGYSGSLDCDSKVKEALEVGPKSPEFTQLIEWLSKELQTICGLDSYVNSITDPDDSSSFLLEVSSFLKELHCPYKVLVSGSISQRLLDVKSRLVLLDFLTTELQAARVVQHRSKKINTLEIEVDDSDTAASLDIVKNVLDIKTDDNDNPVLLFSEIEQKLSDHITINPEVISKAVVDETLTEEQWDTLRNLYKDFFDEYRVRREMLLTRLDVTIQSFKWGVESKGKEHNIVNAYVQKRSKLKKNPSVKLSDVLAARESILIIEKTSSDELVKNTKSSLNRILIPQVPDRGGRPKEQRPPVEMPSWMKRSGDRGGGGGRGGGGWRGGGGGGKRFGGHKKKY